MPRRGALVKACIDRAMEGRRPLCCNVSYADRMHSFHVRSCKGHSHRVCSLEGSTRIVGSLSSCLCSRTKRTRAVSSPREHPVENRFLSAGPLPVSTLRLHFKFLVSFLLHPRLTRAAINTLLPVTYLYDTRSRDHAKYTYMIYLYDITI